jgi:hypothetical protein
MHNAQNLKTFGKIYELVAIDCVIALQYMQYQLRSNGEYVRFFVGI